MSDGLAALMLASTTGGYGVVYERGHEFATKHRLMGIVPVISVWGHSGTSTLQPRVIDLQTAQEYVSMSNINGIAGTERVQGNIADYRVKLHGDD